MDTEKRAGMGKIGRKIAKTLTWDVFIKKWAATIEAQLRGL